MIAGVLILCILAVLLLAFLIGMAAIIGASNDMHRELEDQEQEEFIRNWMAEKKARKEKKQCQKR